MDIKLLITGCGRCGSKYISVLMRAIGYDVPHEKMGAQGVVSWYMATDAEQVPIGPIANDHQFSHSFHLVREPLSAINSISQLSPEAWEFICQHIPSDTQEPLLLRSAKYWYYWNLMAQEKTQATFRVEDEQQIITTLENALDIKIQASMLEQLPKNVNTRQSGRFFHQLEELLIRLKLFKALPALRKLFNQQAPTPKLTWQQLDALDPTLAKNIKQLALEYGYEY